MKYAQSQHDLHVLALHILLFHRDYLQPYHELRSAGVLKQHGECDLLSHGVHYMIHIHTYNEMRGSVVICKNVKIDRIVNREVLMIKGWALGTFEYVCGLCIAHFHIWMLCYLSDVRTGPYFCLLWTPIVLWFVIPFWFGICMPRYGS